MDRKNDSPFIFSALKLARGLCLSFGMKCKPGSLAFCIGSGGTGKSSLAEHIARTVFGEPGLWSIGNVPVVLVGADVPDRGFFSSKSLMHDLLKSLHDPFRSSIPD